MRVRVTTDSLRRPPKREALSFLTLLGLVLRGRMRHSAAARVASWHRIRGATVATTVTVLAVLASGCGGLGSAASTSGDEHPRATHSLAVKVQLPQGARGPETRGKHSGGGTPEVAGAIAPLVAQLAAAIRAGVKDGGISRPAGQRLLSDLQSLVVTLDVSTHPGAGAAAGAVLSKQARDVKPSAQDPKTRRFDRLAQAFYSDLETGTATGIETIDSLANALAALALAIGLPVPYPLAPPAQATPQVVSAALAASGAALHRVASVTGSALGGASSAHSSASPEKTPVPSTLPRPVRQAVAAQQRQPTVPTPSTVSKRTLSRHHTAHAHRPAVHRQRRLASGATTVPRHAATPAPRKARAHHRLVPAHHRLRRARHRRSSHATRAISHKTTATTATTTTVAPTTTASVPTTTTTVPTTTTQATTTTRLPPPSGFPGGYHQLVIDSDRLCLDVYDYSGSPGAAIDQWPCKSADYGNANEQFQFRPVSGGYGELQAANSGEDVAVANASTTEGAPDIVQQLPDGGPSSLWLPIQQSNGSWEFKNQNSGLCLDVYDATSTLGQQLDQWPCKSPGAGTNQAFAIASGRGQGRDGPGAPPSTAPRPSTTSTTNRTSPTSPTSPTSTTSATSPTTTTSPSGPSHGAPAGGATCQADYQISAQWQNGRRNGGGFTVTVTVTAGPSPVTGWKVTWSFAAGQSITGYWRANMAQAGPSVTATNVSYDGSLAPGASTTFGFQGGWVGSNPVPAVACSGTAGGGQSDGG